MVNRFQILALDGGGIKGIFEAAVLAYLEDDLHTRIVDHFDLIVGTSTAGIIALGLGLGLTPKEILQFYVEEALNIFPQRFSNKWKQLMKTKYDSEPLELALKKCFGENRLAESQKQLVIPSYNISEDDVYLFKTPHHKRLKRDYKVPMWKVAMATSAAPTFFPAFQKLDSIRLVDGGVWANNPTMVGIIEAISLLNVPIEHIHVLSLGTTNEVKSRHQNLDDGGYWQWRRSAVDVIMRGQSIGSNTQAMHLLGIEKIVRFDPSVAEGKFGLDKLEVNDLIGKAADKSRHFCPEFEKKYAQHQAKEYVPIYS